MFSDKDKKKKNLLEEDIKNKTLDVAEQVVNQVKTKDNDNKSMIENDLGVKNLQTMNQNYESDLLRLIDFLQNPKSLESNTILDNNEQVVALTLMNWAGQVFDYLPFKQFVATYPKYKISGEGGTGRKQAIQVAEAIRREKVESETRWMDFLRRK